jgi:hydroxypyruvate reductase
VWENSPSSVRYHLETGADESPKADDECFASVTSVVIGNNTKAAEAARVHAALLGYDASVVTTTLAGESRAVGDAIARSALAVQSRNFSHALRRCLIYAGETTVTVTGSGLGGRNQELALGAAIALDGSSGVTVTSIGTDGIDGPTDAAGAVANGESISRARALGIDASSALSNNDSYSFWRDLDDLIVTGPTGTNVMDLVVVTIG